MKVHQKKVWTEFWEDLISLKKTFEIRVVDEEDIAPETGDVLLLMEWDKRKEQYTGRCAMFVVGYVALLHNGGLFGPGEANVPHFTTEYTKDTIAVMAITPLKVGDEQCESK